MATTDTSNVSTRPIASAAAADGDYASVALETYEQRLQADPKWALMEGSQHFGEASEVFKSLEKIANKLKQLGINYAVVGGLALFRHGYRRFTEGIDLLVCREDLRAIHDALSGRGYLPLHPQSKHLRDTETGVRIEFLTTGAFPGDGKPKPVAFPDPAQVSVELDGIHFINLRTLIELKLASGMSNKSRARDLVDVSEFIRAADLPENLAETLNGYVAAEYQQLWSAAQENDQLDDQTDW